MSFLHPIPLEGPDEENWKEAERRWGFPPQYTTTTLPDATKMEGRIIYVQDGGAGAKFRGSDGTNWVNLG